METNRNGEIICLCPHCNKEILMIYTIPYFRVDVKELKTWKSKEKLTGIKIPKLTQLTGDSK